MIVMKFGGTSVQDATAISRAIQAVSLRLSQRPVVVLSAMGKTTDQLLRIAAAAHRGSKDAAQRLLLELEQVHLKAIRNLLSGERLAEAEKRLNQYLRQIANIIHGLYLLGECTPRSKDAVVSFGERMSTLVFSEALREKRIAAALLDSRELIRTDDAFTKAVVIQDISFQRIRETILPRVEAGEIVVLQGFIGSTEEGITTTIGRGGSDYTASLVGAALSVDDVQIWTDVPGILTADPRIVADVLKIKTISFNEASELAYFGAKVLHPSTLLPAVTRNIPVHVCSSSKIDRMGTLIRADRVPCRSPVKSIACKKGITLLNIYSTRMLLAYGFLQRIFELFDRHQTVVDVISTSEVAVSLTIDSTEHLEEILEDLKVFAEVEVEPSVGIVCVVGDNLRHIPGMAARILKAVGQIKIRMISQGASRINLTFVVSEQDISKAVRQLHKEFFKEPDPEVFDPVDCLT